MSTATDTELEALLTGDVPEELHLVCAICWPRWLPPGVAVAACGEQTKGGPIIEDPSGQRRCAKCVAVEATSPLPCGHP